MRFSSLLRLSLCASALALTALTACTSTVVSGIGGGGGSGGSPDTSTNTSTSSTSFTSTGGSGGSGGQSPSAEAIAIRYGDIPDVSGTGSAVASSGSGTTIGPNDTEFVFSSVAVSCGNDFWSFPCNTWRVDFVLPAALLTPGTVDLSTLNVIATMQETEQPPGSGQCGGGGGGGPTPGMLEILAVDATSVTLRITGLDLVGFGGIDINGDHTVLRCPTK